MKSVSGSDGGPVSPGAGVLRWALSYFGALDQLVDIEALHTGSSTHVYTLRVKGRSSLTEVILKVFRNEEWLRGQPHIVQNEIAALKALEATDLPTPTLLQADPRGLTSGVPALLMSHLAGDIVVSEDGMDDRLAALADVLRVLDGIDVAAPQVQSYRPYNDAARLQAPDWSTQPELWAKAFEAVSGWAPQAGSSFIHRDFHPLNVLWLDGSVSGVVDWTTASIGHRSVDLAHCRVNLAQMHGLAVADRFLRLYLDGQEGASFDPMWDLRVAVDWLPTTGGYEGWRALGLHLSPEDTRARLEDFVRSALDSV